MTSKKQAKKASGDTPRVKQGALTDEEKRSIEEMISTSTYSQIAKHLNRKDATVRKYCQRHGVTRDRASVRKQIEFRTKHSHHFIVLKEQLTDEEFTFAIQVYNSMMEQFGNDILYSEEIQLIEYCVVTCLLNRALSKEKTLNSQIQEQRVLRAELQKKKDEVLNSETLTADGEDDDEKEGEKYDQEDYYLDKIEQIDMRISELQSDLRDTKKDQINFIDRKEKITVAIHGSREQRAKELINTKQNFSDLMTAMRKNVQFRTAIGLEIEKMRLGIKEEYIKLTSAPHVYINGEEDFPILNTEVAERIEQ
jgi:hypothetical protein